MAVVAMVALVKRERLAGRAPVTSGGVVAQVWRGGRGPQVLVARLLAGVEVAPLDERLSRRAGVLLGRRGQFDAIDASAVCLADDGGEGRGWMRCLQGAVESPRRLSGCRSMRPDETGTGAVPGAVPVLRPFQLRIGLAAAHKSRKSGPCAATTGTYGPLVEVGDMPTLRIVTDSPQAEGADMDIVSSADLFEELATAQRAGAARRGLRRTIDQVATALSDAMKTSRSNVLMGMSGSAEEQRVAWRMVVDSTSGLAAAHEAVAQLASWDRRASKALNQTAAAAAELIKLASLNVPKEMLPVEAAEQFASVPAEAANPKRLAQRLLSSGLAAPGTGIAELLRLASDLRLQALHALLLIEIAHATPDAGAVSEAAVSDACQAARAAMRGLRDEARSAGSLLRTGTAGPVFATRLWVALFRAESWLLESGAAAVAATAAAAGGRAQAGDADSERWSREAALAYDACRQLLALDGGVRTVLSGYALHDAGVLAEFEGASGLPVREKTVDLPRSTFAEAASAADGAEVEVAGIVSDLVITAGGPAPRSVLQLGSLPGARLRVLVPFIAVNSFGISPGTWLQVRGITHPMGKDDLDGPVLQVSRIRRQRAAELSFTDALVFAGRSFFELRPGGWDIVAGRLAGNDATLTEIGMRALVS